VTLDLRQKTVSAPLNVHFKREPEWRKAIAEASSIARHVMEVGSIGSIVMSGAPRDGALRRPELMSTIGSVITGNGSGLWPWECRS
jgi:hypothetical protein